MLCKLNMVKGKHPLKEHHSDRVRSELGASSWLIGGYDEP